MKFSLKKSLLFIVIALTLMVSVLGVTPVFADDETPPPAPVETEEPVTGGADEPPAPVQEPPASPAEVLEQLPAEVPVVVLDENAEVLPLAAQDSAEIIATVDPIWCPAGQAPTPGANGCTGTFLTPQALIDDMDLNPAFYDADGVIYFTADPGGAFLLVPGTLEKLTTADYNVLKLNDLTLQGGWSGTSGDTNFTQTVFTENAVQIGTAGNPWVGNITINNITVQGAAGEGLYVLSKGDIHVNNVTARDNGQRGARLVNTTGTGSVTVQNSTFTGNGGAGLRVESSGNVTLSEITADGNANGAVILTPAGLSVGGSSFNGNTTTGLLFNLTGTAGSVSIETSTFNDNTTGATVTTLGNLDVSNSSFDSNTGAGLLFNLVGAAGNITIEKSTFNGNASGATLRTSGSIVVSCSEFSTNTQYGINAPNATGPMELASTTFSGNGTADYRYNGSGLTITDVLCNPIPPTPVLPVGDGGKSMDEVLYYVIEKLEDQVPAGLPAGNSLVSAFEVVLTPRGEKVENLLITLSFPIPAGMQADNLAVLLWNGMEWVQVPGGSVVNDRFVVTVSGAGFYVLVSR